MTTTEHTEVAREAGRPHMAFVEGIRGLSATYVVFHHLWQFAIADRPSPSWFRVASVFKYGEFGVAVFVVVSGYCLMLPVMSDSGLRLRGGLSRFAKRRTLRIIPPYYAALAFTFVVLGLFSEMRSRTGTPQDITLPTFTWPKTLSHVFSIHNWTREWRWGINPPHWTVALEFQIYFVFAIVLLPVWRRFGPAPAVGVAFAIGFALMGVGLGFAAPWMLGLFALGMVAAAISMSPDAMYERLRVIRWSRVSVVAWLMVPVAVVVATKLTPGASAWMIEETVVGVATMAGLIALSRHQLQQRATRSAVTDFLTWRPIRLLGDISYSTYLLHYPIVAAVAIVWIRDFNWSAPVAFAVSTLVCWPIILAASVTFHHLIEQPFYRRRVS
jgi:peptidoglycan/LPS O-acetylase OafA/YrhL